MTGIWCVRLLIVIWYGDWWLLSAIWCGSWLHYGYLAATLHKGGLASTPHDDLFDVIVNFYMDLTVD